MGLVKITPADKYFSLCVRERAEWICEKCKTQYEKGSQGLHCSHLFSRRHKRTRYAPDNAFAHCMGCHQYLGGNPVVFSNWARQALGQERLERLDDDHRRTIKHTKERVKEIAAHYKAQWERLMQRRFAGETGRLEFEAYKED